MSNDEKPPRSRPTAALRNAQELEVLLLEERDGVADALGEDRLEVGAVGRVRVATGQVGLGDVGDGVARVAEDRRPLLDLLEEILGVERRVAAWRPHGQFVYLAYSFGRR